ncbi:MAG: hypothetical protein U9Q07_12305 [Planctomycetota bacterium]|nr:hypothetical protein [Planctomycetota bacterium]
MSLGSPAQAGEVAAAIPDPATSAKQDTINTSLGSPAQAGEAASATSALALESGGNLADIKTAVETIDNPVSGSEMLIAGGATQANDVKVTLDSETVELGAGTAAIGKLTENSGVDIGDVDVTSVVPGVGAANLGKAEDQIHVHGHIGVMALGVRNDAATAFSGADGDYTPVCVTENGHVAVSGLIGPGAVSVDSYTSAVVDCASGATTEVIAAPGASKQLWIYGLMGTADTVDTTIVLKSATTAKTGTMPMADNGGFVLPPSGNFIQPWIKCATNEAFQITTATGTFDGIVTYAIVSV